MSDRKVRVGVLGAGTWARGGAPSRLRAAIRGASWSPSPTPSATAREAAAREFGIPRVAADTPSSFARDDIDLIDVCTPSAHALRAGLGGARGRQARALREAGRLRLPRHAARRAIWRAAAASRRSSASRSATVPAMRYMKASDRPGLRRHAVHLQRLRAELAVARPGDATAPGGSRGRPVGPPGLVARRLRRADHRPRRTDGRSRPVVRSSARCATSSPSAWSARPGA